jgi:hypothetical protein
MRALLVAGFLILALPANATSIGDWIWRIQPNGKGFVTANISSLDKTIEALVMFCDDAGKFQLRVGPRGNFTRLMTDNATYQLKELTVQNSAGLLKELLAEESAAKQAGAKSFTFTFHLNDEKGAGYSANMGGLSRARDFVMKRCTGGRTVSDGERIFIAEPWLAPDRRRFLQFYQGGHYNMVDLRTKKEVYAGTFFADSANFILDDGTDDRMACRRSIEPNGNMLLAGCPFAGRWVPMRNVR